MKYLPLCDCHATICWPKVAQQVTSEFIRHQMNQGKLKVKHTVADTGIDKTSICAWMNGVGGMSQLVKLMFYYFQVKSYDPQV